MVYKVKKRIKGRLYLYEQRSWREGGKVKTHSRYLGPCGAGDGAQVATVAPAPVAANPTRLGAAKVTTTRKRPRGPLADQAHASAEPLHGLERIKAWNQVRKLSGGIFAAQKALEFYRSCGPEQTEEIIRFHYDEMRRWHRDRRKVRGKAEKKRCDDEARACLDKLVAARFCARILAK